MNGKTTTLILIVLLAGAAAIAFMNGKKPGDGSAAIEGGAAEKSGGVRASLTGGDGGGSTAKKSVDRSAREIKNEELVARYGEVRTALSRKVAGNVLSLLDDAVAMGEMMTQGGGQQFGGRRGMMRGALGQIGIELDEEQQERAMEIYAEFQKREVAKTKMAADELRKDSTVLMELFLAGDAKERGEMDESEYAMVQAEVAERMPDVINPLDRNNFRGGQPLKDEQLMSDFKAILNEEQGVTFDEFVDKQDAELAEKPQANGDISNIPSMELDTLDGAIGSARKVVGGIRSMMEGMGGLQDLRPQIEGESRGE